MATFKIQGAFAPGGRLVIVGQVTEGVLQVGQKADVGGTTYRLAQIEKKHQQISQAQAGDSVGLFFDGPTDKNQVATGQTLAFQ